MQLPECYTIYRLMLLFGNSIWFTFKPHYIDNQIRTISLRIGRLGLLPSLIKMMAVDTNSPSTESIAWALVYQISLDDRGRILISRSECLSFVLEYLLRCQQNPLPSVPLALAINLALNPKLATQLCQVYTNSHALILSYL